MSEQPGYFSTLVSRFGEGWNRFWFTPADPLPLGVVRVGVGLIALYVVVTFGFDLRRFFDPQTGLLPLETVKAVQEQTGRSVRFSYFDYATDALTLQMMHYAGVAVLASFTVGLWTRLTSILSVVVFLSYMHRGPMLLNVGEPVIAMLLFYLALGPCGAALSLDAKRRRKRDPQTGSPSWGANVVLRLIQVHVALIYFLMFCGKTQNNFVWWNGMAVWWLIARPESALINLRWMADAPYLINLWTTGILAFELAFPVLIWNRTARPLILGLSAILWTGTFLITGLGPFCAAMFVAGLSFSSAETWRRLLPGRS